MDVLKRVPVREQDPKVRATNFEEVCLGYNQEEAQEEAARCLNCKNARCVQGCPVKIDIPAFVKEVKEGIRRELLKMSERRTKEYKKIVGHLRRNPKVISKKDQEVLDDIKKLL